MESSWLGLLFDGDFLPFPRLWRKRRQLWTLDTWRNPSHGQVNGSTGSTRSFSMVSRQHPPTSFKPKKKSIVTYGNGVIGLHFMANKYINEMNLPFFSRRVFLSIPFQWTLRKTCLCVCEVKNDVSPRSKVSTHLQSAAQGLRSGSYNECKVSKINIQKQCPQNVWITFALVLN